ncbi:L,D-transpeptidase [Amycolatopsis sp. NEAU-NG30]|uniref:L,D-transpeptidase n=1 Tax=Amycolatopsis melonis TaxID=3156488 RepID=A0ABV0LHC3_9PSEU
MPEDAEHQDHAAVDDADHQDESAAVDTVPATPARGRHRRPPAESPRGRGTRWALAALVALALLAAATWAGCGTNSDAVMQRGSLIRVDVDDAPIVPPQPVTAQQLAELPRADTFSTVTAAPRDPEPGAIPGGRLVHPAAVVPIYASPGGPAIAALPPTELVSDTWLPVIADRPGWAEVLLPVRPNGSAGWIYLDPAVTTTAHSPFRIEVDRGAFTLTLLRDGHQFGRWTVGVGKPGSPTPATRTFILASIRDTHPTFSPVVLATGAHSDTYTTYGGGPGTVGVHGWPTADVFGRPSSDGCIRIPPDALQVISTQVPIGSPVLIR